MAKKPSRRHYKRAKKYAKKYPLLTAVIVVLAILAYLVYYFFLGGNTTPAQTTKPPHQVSGQVELHMIDVGQGDAILIASEEGYMLIDTGDNTNDSRNALTSYLQDLGVTTLDWLVLTHPDADHIGGAEKVLEMCEVENVMLSDITHSSQLYINMMEAILESDANIHIVEEKNGEKDTETGNLTASMYHAGDTFSWGEIDYTILGPISIDQDDRNNASVVLRMVYGTNSFLLTGDMEKEEEEELLSYFGAEFFNCDILKVGHHGSGTSSSAALLAKATPKYALISCGEGNKYGHPHSEAITRLEGANATIYRTDLVGHIVVVSDGTTVSVSTSK